jgi:ribulose-phosphate 3-epimerase
VATLGASILAADLARLADEVKLVGADADLIHIDVMDGHFVSPLTIGPPVVAALRAHTALPLHAHLQVEAPEALIDDLAAAGTDAVSFQHEAGADAAPLHRKIREAGMRTGIALAPETPADVILGDLEELDHVVVLAVDPGWAGQRFQIEALAKIETIRAEIDRRGLDVDVHVDGGVNLETVGSCVNAGADVVVAASAIFAAGDPARAAHDLRRAAGAA